MEISKTAKLLMEKIINIISYILLWSMIICLLIIGLRYLKVELDGKGNQWLIGLYIVIGGLYSSLAVIPSFLIIDYFIYIPKIKKKIILNSIRFITLFVIITIVALIERLYF